MAGTSENELSRNMRGEERRGEKRRGEESVKDQSQSLFVSPICQLELG